MLAYSADTNTAGRYETRPSARARESEPLYQALINKYLPLRKISNKEKKSLLKPWITRGTKVSIKVRYKLLRKTSRNKSDSLNYVP